MGRDSQTKEIEKPPGDRALLGPRSVGRPPSSRALPRHKTQTTNLCGVSPQESQLNS